MSMLQATFESRRYPGDRNMFDYMRQYGVTNCMNAYCKNTAVSYVNQKIKRKWDIKINNDNNNNNNNNIKSK